MCCVADQEFRRLCLGQNREQFLGEELGEIFTWGEGWIWTSKEPWRGRKHPSWLEWMDGRTQQLHIRCLLGVGPCRQDPWVGSQAEG